MAGPLIADTGGLLRAITKRPDRRPMWPPFARTLATASRVVVPGPVLTEVDSSGSGAAARLAGILVTCDVTGERIGEPINDFLRLLSKFLRHEPTRGDTKRPA